MKEITRITTVRFTHVFKEEPDRIADKVTSEEEKCRYAKRLEHILKTMHYPDDVNVTDVQCFVSDMEE